VQHAASDTLVIDSQCLAANFVARIAAYCPAFISGLKITDL